MDISKVIGKNVEIIKQKYGLSNEDLGELLGVTRQTIAKYINGEQVIDSAKLFKLSSHFNLGIDYFMKNQKNELSFMYRADNPQENLEEKNIMMINNKLLSYCELSKLEGSEDDVYIPESYRISVAGRSLSSDEKEKIKDIADRVRRSIGLEDELDIYRVLEDHGINVLAMKLNEKMDALSAYSEEHGAFILINDRDDLPEERKRFSCAHELGHLILHRDDYKRSQEELNYTSARMNIREKMANLFASHLLIPRQTLHREFKRVKGRRRNIDFSDIVMLKKRFNVSAQSLILALKEENLISPGMYGFYNKYIKERIGNSEPYPIEPIEKNKKLKLILMNLAKSSEVTTNKIAEMLDMNIRQSRELMKVWADSDSNVEYH